ncbi:putative letm1-like protein [Erysiphe necator]|uniref:Putative letm1-like protein n=1 Tax=Uncinula necator TaxID=52586 RepID=A0A0B1PAV6_UNCNE|nr:putative letm1-like protein [Erysiphe necator]
MSQNRFLRIGLRASYKNRIKLNQSKLALSFQQTICTSNYSLVNGPLSTLPTEIEFQVRKPDQKLISYYFRLGKAYLQFYKVGIKNIYYNYKASLPIKELIDSKYEGSISQAVNANAISRSEFQLLTRNWHDLKRVPLFGLMFAIFGEFTPLLVIAIGNVVPLTCRTPTQIRKERKRLEESRYKAFQKVVTEPPIKGLSALRLQQLMLINSSLGLSSRMWNLFGGPPAMILTGKIKRRMEYLSNDDRLIEISGGVKKMSTREVEMALVERGIDVIGRLETDLRHDLKSWLRLRRDELYPYERLLLTRPSMWTCKVI